MNAQPASASDQDIEMGVPGDLPTLPPKKKNCWGKTFTDFSQGLEVVITAGSTTAAVVSYVYGQYIVAGICTGIFALSVVNTVRIHCLGRMKDQNKQNDKLAHNINNLSKDKFDLEKQINILQEKITQIETEKKGFEQENSKINTSLEKKVKEIQKLNVNLTAAEKKAAEFETLYTQFKSLEAELSKQTSNLQQNDKDLQRINNNLDKEKNNLDKLDTNIDGSIKKFDNENQQFSGKLKEFQQLIASTQQQIQTLQKSYIQIKQANDEFQKKEAQFVEQEKQNALMADNLKQAEVRLAEFNKKFKSFVEHLRSLSHNIPELKPLLENIDAKNS